LRARTIPADAPAPANSPTKMISGARLDRLALTPAAAGSGELEDGKASIDGLGVAAPGVDGLAAGFEGDDFVVAVAPEVEVPDSGKGALR
jgi:hypothetical protein